MKTSIGICSRLALVAGISCVQLLACSADTHSPHAEEQRSTGTLALALEANSSSGSTYRLVNAFFQITEIETGKVVDFLSSDAAPPSARELTTILLTGRYSVTLQEGWLLERLNGGGGTAGSAGVANGGAGNTGGGRGGSAGFGVGGAGKGGGFGSSGAFSHIDLGGDAGGVPAAGRGPGPIAAGAPSGGSSSSPDGEFVTAQLLSDAVQLFSLFGSDDAFVSYQFKVGSEVVDFRHGKLHIGIGVIDDGNGGSGGIAGAGGSAGRAGSAGSAGSAGAFGGFGGGAQCLPPDGTVHTQRVLLETNTTAVSSISLPAVLKAIAVNDGQVGDPQLIYHQIIDSYATRANGRLPDAIHCGDETTGDGQPALNGYPIDCDRVERFQFDNQNAFFPTAFVNRIDLAPQNGSHCGQQRVIFANNAQNRMFMIFEAQIPNPAPELGIAGCTPLAQFWLDANTIDDPKARGRRLADAFVLGDPQLQAAGFGPFLSATHFTVGSGQIRTNQFDQAPWTLREFKLALDGNALKAVPFPVAEAPAGALWNEMSGLAQGPSCRENFLQAVDGLLSDDPAQMSFIVDSACKDAESRNDGSQNYNQQLSAGFRSSLAARLIGTGLSTTDIANRAQFAGSCIGCHEEAVGLSLGHGVIAPFSNGFVQVQEFPVGCTNGDIQGQCFQASPALRTVFLPSRLRAMSTVVGQPLIPNPCDDSGSGGFGGFGGFSGPTPGGMGPGGTAPAPVVNIVLPSADLPVAQLEAEDAKVREGYGDKTISGRSAQSTH